MNRRGRALTPDEAALWRRVARSVSPLRPASPDPPEEPPASRPSGSTRGPTSPPRTPGSWALGSSPRAESPPKRPSGPADRAGERRVRRGKLEIAGKLDLHGHTQDQALAALRRFLAHHRSEGASVVLIVTGKGGRAGEGTGVLKRRVPDWLALADIRPMVAGFAEAHPRHGGGGALYVFLKRG